MSVPEGSGVRPPPPPPPPALVRSDAPTHESPPGTSTASTSGTALGTLRPPVRVDLKELIREVLREDPSLLAATGSTRSGGSTESGK